VAQRQIKMPVKAKRAPRKNRPKKRRPNESKQKRDVNCAPYIAALSSCRHDALGRAGESRYLRHVCFIPDNDQIASGSIPLFLIVLEACGEARNSISRLSPSNSSEPATTAAENTWTNWISYGRLGAHPFSNSPTCIGQRACRVRQLLPGCQTLMDHAHHRRNILECAGMRVALQMGQIEDHDVLSFELGSVRFFFGIDFAYSRHAAPNRSG